MSLAETVYQTLRQEWDSGLTQEEVAEKHNIKHGQVQPILSGKRSAGGLHLDTFDRMFPNATFNLNGDGVNAANSGTVHGVVGLNSGTVNTSAPAASESFRLRVLEAVIDLDIPSDALQIVLKTIKEIKP